MKTITEKFADVTQLFASDGYGFLVVRSKLEEYEKHAAEGNTDAAKIVEVFNRFHRLMLILSK